MSINGNLPPAIATWIIRILAATILAMGGYLLNTLEQSRKAELEWISVTLTEIAQDIKAQNKEIIINTERLDSQAGRMLAIETQLAIFLRNISRKTPPADAWPH